MHTPLSLLLVTATAAAGPAREGTVPSKDGVAIHYLARGRGEPALVFVHGWGIHGGYWKAEVAAFARRRTVVALDLAGHGRSGREGRKEWTVAAFAEDVRAVVEGLGLKKVILAGHSMSGNVVLEAARLMPGRVVGIIPVDTLVDPDQRYSDEDMQGFLAAFRADYPAAVREFVVKRLFTPKVDPALAESVVRDIAGLPPAISIAVLAGANSYDPRPALSGLKVPMVAVNTDLHPTNLVALRKYAPQYEVLLVPGLGHYPMREDPAAFGAQLARAIAKIESTPAAGR